MTARAVNTATLDDDTIRESLEYIAANLRPADAAEIKATVEGEEDLFWPIVESWFDSTMSWLILDKTGLPVGVFGVSPHAAMGVGIVWLVGTDGLDAIGLALGRQTLRYVKEMQEIYPILWANVDGRNSRALQWLSRAGFTLADSDLHYGPERRLFHTLIRTR